MRAMRIAVVAAVLGMSAGLGVAAPAVADPSGLRGQGGNGNANILCNLPTTRFSTFTATVPTIGTSTPPAVPPDCGPES